MTSKSWEKTTTTDAEQIPLVRRFPALAEVPRVELGSFPTPVEKLEGFPVPGELWIKRDDLTAAELGGNKVRALEFLLAARRQGETVLTIGGEGSTHVLATAFHAQRLGVHTSAISWRHDMSDTSLAVAARAFDLCGRITMSRFALSGLSRAMIARWADPSRYIPLGGSSPRGILGHVNAGLELAAQVASGELPLPNAVVVPLGTGGTAAGLALGFSIAKLKTVVVGARVGPRAGANRWRVLRLARATTSLIAKLTGERLPRLSTPSVTVVHDVYGGGYGRPSVQGTAAANAMQRIWGLKLDATYSAKAFAAALALARTPNSRILFWLTFDARWMSEWKAVAGDAS
ncbi:MAG: pyridoxal-phosphate dependent enzyme [Anaerolineae bacterium]|nr:pyridoxal-phosphate dependent enzyme [Gemmatimonadaceae bacterium]